MHQPVVFLSFLHVNVLFETLPMRTNPSCFSQSYIFTACFRPFWCVSHVSYVTCVTHVTRHTCDICHVTCDTCKMKHVWYVTCVKHHKSNIRRVTYDKCHTCVKCHMLHQPMGFFSLVHFPSLFLTLLMHNTLWCFSHSYIFPAWLTTSQCAP